MNIRHYSTIAWWYLEGWKS